MKSLLSVFALTVSLPMLSGAQDTWIGASNGIVLTQQPSFNATNGELRLPALRIDGVVDIKSRYLSNVVLSLNIDDRFEVIDYGEFPSQLFCEEDISAAIPQLSLDSTLEEITALVGCQPKYLITETDLEMGKRVVAQFSPTNFIPTLYPANSNDVITAINFNTGEVFNALALQPLTSSYNPFFSSAGITMTFLEGDLQSYSYPPESNILQYCDEAELLAGFALLTSSSSLNDVESSFTCVGYVSSILVTPEGEQQVSSWRSPSFLTTPVNGPSSAPPSYTVLSGNFRDQTLLSLTRYTNQPQLIENVCTVTELSSAYATMFVGMNESQLLNTISCDSSLVNSEEELGGSSAKSYYWNTSVSNDSLLLTPNRRMIVELSNGIVSNIVFSRY